MPIEQHFQLTFRALRFSVSFVLLSLVECAAAASGTWQREDARAEHCTRLQPLSLPLPLPLPTACRVASNVASASRRHADANADEEESGAERTERNGRVAPSRVPSAD